MQSVVHTIGLTKVFKDFWRRDKVVAVQDLDLDIEPGEVFGLLGPNGSGKSTTIKMLLGLLHPTKGRISIFGRPPTDVATKERIGYLPEESYLYRFLNARETLDLYGKLFDQGGDMRRKRVDKLLEMVGLQHQARRRIGEYSKGMARRIGLAQALINDPDFLILDEPTTGMDPLGTRQIKQLIRELAGRGKTILLSSHLLSDVQDVCDRVCILYGGQVQAAGRVGELLSQQEMTQIKAPRLTEQTLDRVRKAIAGQDAAADIEVTHPTERLENYFIRIVENARASEVTTSGVGAGSGVADFLSEHDGEAIIDQLVAAPAAAPQPVAAPAVDAAPEPKAEVIQELIKSDPVEEPEPQSADPDPAPAGEPEGDRSFLDSLTSKPEDHTGG